MVNNLSLNSTAASANGAKESFTAPSKPPSRLPSLSGIPKTAFLNSSVDIAIPIPEPISKDPTNPNPPRESPGNNLGINNA